MVEFYDQERLIEKISELMEEIKPDVVLTFHEIFGGHPDHCAIGKATTAACQRTGRQGSLYFISFGDAMEAPERFGYTKKDVVKVDIRHHLAAKLAAFRAHRCQTEMDKWVWESDHKALGKFGRFEYFLAAQVAPQQAMDDLFQPI